jgi:hypothetical protein
MVEFFLVTKEKHNSKQTANKVIIRVINVFFCTAAAPLGLVGQTPAQRSSALSRCGVNAVAKELGQLTPQPLVPWIFVQVCVPELVDDAAVHRQRQWPRRQSKGACHALYHDPYYQRHVVGAPIVRRVEDGRIHAEANYAVFRTKLDKESTVFNVGRYIDTIVHTPEGFKFAERLCVYDSEMIPNSIIYPI